MPRYVKGDDVVETSSPVEGVRLRAAGYTEQKARTKDVRAADEQRAAEQAPSTETTGK